MTTQINATYHVTNWDEQTYLEIDPEKKLTRANVQQKISGDIEGEGSVDYLMCYQQNQSASYIGLQRIVGKIGERSGSFVLQETGVFDGQKIESKLHIVEGSGTGDFVGITGNGTVTAPLGSTASVQLRYKYIADA